MKQSYTFIIWLGTGLLASILSVSLCFSHPGKVDKTGGHHDHKTSVYHFHTKIKSDPRSGTLQIEPEKTRAELQVLLLQVSLKYLGLYSGDLNGEVNNKTTHALKSFQLNKGLVITGFIDDETKEYLFEDLKKKPLNY
ncbi:hypothetical protein HOG98_05095 [bacterium]|jgi:hypothetical protein|nr:hypothetical protein [bacterium]